jgi:hypothetical protein
VGPVPLITVITSESPTFHFTPRLLQGDIYFFVSCRPQRSVACHATVTFKSHPGSQRRAHILNHNPQSRRVAVPVCSESRHRESCPGKCTETAVDRHSSQNRVEGAAESCLQPRGLQRCAAIEALQGARNGPLVRGHEGRRNLP